jgi:alpha-tubulin suppressor-like RCC1 family protein
MENVAIASAGTNHSMALTNNGHLYIWGTHWGDIVEYDPIGNPVPRNNLEPTRILENIDSISAGDMHSMAIDINGTLFGWGLNRQGQLGISDINEFISEPMEIMHSVREVSAGARFTVAMDNEGVLWAWGTNEHGQLGGGTTNSSDTPIRIAR